MDHPKLIIGLTSFDQMTIYQKKFFNYFCSNAFFCNRSQFRTFTDSRSIYLDATATFILKIEIRVKVNTL